MGVVSFVVCDICGNVIDDGHPVVVVYTGVLAGTDAGRAKVSFAQSPEQPLHHHAECHEESHVTPVGFEPDQKGLMN